MNLKSKIKVRSNTVNIHKISYMGVLLFLIMNFTNNFIYAANFTSLQNGNWINSAVWSPSIVPSFFDNIRIKHSIVNFTNSNLNGYLLVDSTGVLTTLDIDVQNGATLIVYGTLNLSNLTLSNGSNLHVCSSGVLSVSNDFKNKNNTVNVIIDGIMIVNGDFDNGFGGIINGAGVITTRGFYLGAGETFGIIPTSSIPSNSSVYVSLPVKLSSFNCFAEESEVNFSWISSTESNCNYYLIERSFDANNYMEIVKITSQNEPNLEYKYCDKTPKIGTNYYRLWNVDYNGVITLLKETVAFVDVAIGKIKIDPNPFYENFKVVFDDNNFTNMKIVIIDNIGRVVLESKLDSKTNEFIIDSKDINQSGIYYFNIYENSENIYSKTLVKSDT